MFKESSSDAQNANSCSKSDFFFFFLVTVLSFCCCFSSNALPRPKQSGDDALKYLPKHDACFGLLQLHRF